MRKISGLVALLLAATLAPTSSADAATEAGGLKTRTVPREYGDGPVRIGSTQVLKVRFDGGQGDRVRIDGSARCPLSLRGPDGTVARQASGFWRLADRGVHTFTLQRCEPLRPASRIQLMRLVVRPLLVDGPGTVLNGKRGYVEAVRARVPASGRLQVATPSFPSPNQTFDSLVLPGGTTFPVPYSTGYYLEDGRPIAGDNGRLRGGGGSGALVTHAGDRVLFLATEPLTVWASIPVRVPVVVDAPATPLPAVEVSYRQVQVEFDAVAGDWLHAEVTDPVTDPVIPTGATLLGPHGYQFGRSTYWHLPTTGRYRLMLPTGPTTSPSAVRIRTIRQVAAPMPVDGTPMTFTAVEPGEWVMAPMTLASGTSAWPGFYRLNAGTASTSGEWTALATGQTDLHCPRLSNGCGDWSYGVVSPTVPTSSTFGLSSGLPNPWLVMLQMAQGQTGSVDLSVTVSPTSN